MCIPRLIEVHNGRTLAANAEMPGKDGNSPAKLFAIATARQSRGEVVWNIYLGQVYPLEQAAALAREVEDEGAGR